MANIFPARVVAHPSYTVPEPIIQYNQASNAFDLLATEAPMPRLSEGDLFAYINVIGITTKTQAGQSASNQLPSATVRANQINTPTYLLRTHAEYDHHDIAAGANWNVSVPEAQRLGMRQGIYQEMRNAELYGFNPANGEGIISANGITSVNLPPDSAGDTTVVTYDNGQMAFFLLTQILNIKVRMYQLGMPCRVEIVGPQRVLGLFEYPNIVQLVQFQRLGAGSETTKGVIEDILNRNGDTLGWGYDDTLIGKGSSGTDAVVITIPEIKRPNVTGPNTNEFALLTPSLSATVMQLCDMAAPREISVPLALGAIDVLSELRVTPGWPVRPEAVTVVSMQYQ